MDEIYVLLICMTDVRSRLFLVKLKGLQLCELASIL